MDYDQSGKQDEKNQFFAVSGVGNKVKNPEEAKPEIEVLYSKDSEKPDHNLEGLGSSAMESAKDPSEPTIPDLNQTTDLKMPPGPKDHSSKIDPIKAATNIAVDYKVETTEKGLSEGGQKAIESEIREFEASGNAEKFYNDIREEGGLIDQNLKTSWGREIGKVA